MGESGFMFTGGISILAVIMAFYSVVLGTQRIPNFITSIYILIKYSIIYLLLASASLFIYETCLKKYINSNWLFVIQCLFFLLIVFSLGYFLLKEYHKVFSMRCYYHVLDNFTKIFYSSDEDNSDTLFLEDSQVDDFCKNFIPNQKQEITELYRKRKSGSFSLYCEIENRIVLDKKLLDIAIWALKQDLNLLYLSCRRHPYEFIDLLKNEIEEHRDIGQWRNLKKQILLVDAHTRHYGFREPVYKRKTKMIEDEKIIIEVAKWSYVGIHSAIAHGYKRKLKIDNRKDKATLLIYDSCYALSDLENDKLYRIFLKHVIPSERSMGGNITVFAEQWVPEQMRSFIKIAVDAVIKTPKKRRQWKKNIK